MSRFQALGRQKPPKRGHYDAQAMFDPAALKRRTNLATYSVLVPGSRDSPCCAILCRDVGRRSIGSAIQLTTASELTITAACESDPVLPVGRQPSVMAAPLSLLVCLADNPILRTQTKSMADPCRVVCGLFTQ
jgi:hypothetical protein